MRRFGLTLLVAVSAVLLIPATAHYAAAKGGKKGPEKVKGPAPIAKAAEIKELKGEFTWGMTPAQVKEKLFAKIDENYKDRLEKYRLDPAKSDAVRAQIKADKDRISKSYVKFEGRTPGWEVSIIDEEFVPNNGESMLVYQEAKQKRYFFFNGEALFKMFIAFDKEMLEGKKFKDFGAAMQGKFGKAQEVYVTRNDSVGVKERKLDHLLWRSSTGDGLKLVDRSEFYDVYCLVLYDNSVDQRLAAVRKQAEANKPKGSMLDGVVGGKESDRDENDNVMDRITGKEILKPGDRRAAQQNITVPSAGAPPAGGGADDIPHR